MDHYNPPPQIDGPGPAWGWGYNFNNQDPNAGQNQPPQPPQPPSHSTQYPQPQRQQFQQRNPGPRPRAANSAAAAAVSGPGAGYNSSWPRSTRPGPSTGGGFGPRVPNGNGNPRNSYGPPGLGPQDWRATQPQQQQSPVPGSVEDLHSVPAPAPAPSFTWAPLPLVPPSQGQGPSAPDLNPPPPPPPLSPPPLPPEFPWPFVPVELTPEDIEKSCKRAQEEALKNLKKVIDPNLPQDLKDLFQPLYCQLCQLTLTSTIVATDHYSGKKHKKKVDIWFGQHRSNNPNRGYGHNDGYRERGVKRPLETNKRFPLGKPPNHMVKKPKAEGGGPTYGYCELCDVTLTSAINAEQHYSGRPHNLKLNEADRCGIEVGNANQDRRFGIGRSHLEQQQQQQQQEQQQEPQQRHTPGSSQQLRRF